MKKISLLLLSIATCLFAFAQNANFGLKGGINIANLTNISNSDSRIGVNLGGFVHIHVSPELAVQPELVYSDQGVEYSSGGQIHKLHLNYLNIPVLIQYMTGGGLRLQTGPQIGILTSAHDKVNDVETGSYISNDFKNTDVSWSFGLSFVGASGLGLDARYNVGLTSINNFGVSEWKNNVFQAGLFYQFPGYSGRYRR